MSSAAGSNWSAMPKVCFFFFFFIINDSEITVVTIYVVYGPSLTTGVNPGLQCDQ